MYNEKEAEMIKQASKNYAEFQNIDSSVFWVANKSFFEYIDVHTEKEDTASPVETIMGRQEVHADIRED